MEILLIAFWYVDQTQIQDLKHQYNQVNTADFKYYINTTFYFQICFNLCHSKLGARIAFFDDNFPLYTNNLPPNDILVLAHDYNDSLSNVSVTDNTSYSNVSRHHLKNNQMLLVSNIHNCTAFTIPLMSLVTQLLIYRII